MSALQKSLVAGERVALLGGGETFQVLTGGFKGKRFMARLDVQPAAESDVIFGKDQRMVSTLSVLPDNFPQINQIEHSAVVQAVETGSKYKLTKRDINPSSTTVDFKAELTQ